LFDPSGNDYATNTNFLFQDSIDFSNLQINREINNLIKDVKINYNTLYENLNIGFKNLVDILDKYNSKAQSFYLVNVKEEKSFNITKYMIEEI